MAFLCKCTESQSKYQTKKVSHPNDFFFDWHFPLSDLYLLVKKSLQVRFVRSTALVLVNAL